MKLMVEMGLERDMCDCVDFVYKSYVRKLLYAWSLFLDDIIEREKDLIEEKWWIAHTVAVFDKEYFDDIYMIRRICKLDIGA